MDVAQAGVTSFAAAAATSVRAPRFPVGDHVRVKTFDYEHTAVVLHNSQQMGADGRHWVKVAVTTASSREPWEVHVQAHELGEDR